MTGPHCGNNPNRQLTDGDRQAVAEFRAYLADRAQEQAATDRAAELLAPLAAKANELRARQDTELRAATLREAATVADQFTARYVDMHAMKAAGIIGPHTMAGAIGDELRRMADEAPQQEPAAAAHHAAAPAGSVCKCPADHRPADEVQQP